MGQNKTTAKSRMRHVASKLTVAMTIMVAGVTATGPLAVAQPFDTIAETEPYPLDNTVVDAAIDTAPYMTGSASLADEQPFVAADHDAAQSYTMTAKVSGAKKVTRTTYISGYVATETPARDVIVSVEIYDTNDTQVYQKYYTGQTLGRTATEYSYEYLPQQEGDFTVDIGVYDKDWNLIAWQDAAAEFTIDPVTTAQESYSASTAVQGGGLTSQTMTLTTDVTAQRTTEDSVVDVEVYNATGGRVLQKYFKQQAFAAGETRSYDVAFTPTSAEDYVVKVGVFSGDWSELYHWTDGTARFTVELNPIFTFRALTSVNAGANTGGDEAWHADRYFVGGTSVTSSEPVNLEDSYGAAPAAVYSTSRQGESFDYQITGLDPDKYYVLRMHFNESEVSAVGARTFDVHVNNDLALSAYDIFKEAGQKQHKAVVNEIGHVSDAEGNLTLTFTGVAGEARLAGIEVLGYGELLG
ncbi:hypothetical protein CR983_02365 [Candidatus Saccharibacteria bacterium]|nr:MAG: hypothetical protein CR983_02365 [Candidatus Saccharibacteria bacterium]